MRKKLLGFGLFLFLIVSLFAVGFLKFPTAGVQSGQEQKAPVNKAFADFLEASRIRPPNFISDDGHRLGYIPPPVDLSHVSGAADERVRLVTYPASYDLRTTGKLTSVKDQGGCGSCWTFGAYASLESFLKPGETRDFSEQDLNATHGFDFAECGGGNSLMSHAYLGRWSGPLNESDVPYPYASFSPQKHVQQVIWLPARTSKTDNDTIKYFVTNYGALYFAFYYSSTYWNATTKSYYNNVSTSSNHAVAFVGWDDNYDKNKFNTVPAGNGAFICKNSWGTSWGDSGFFYISYYDTSIREPVAFNNAEATTNYTAVYQYDPLGWVWNNNNYCSPTTTGWGANIFTASASHSITAIGFITNDKNTAYEIYVYKGVTAGQPRSGTLAATKTGTNTYPGYYTVKLASPVSLTNGEKFSVVIKFQNPSYGYPVTTEGYLSGYASKATSHAGESFISCNGTSWTDMYTWYYYDNCNIKAFVGTASVCTPNPKADLLGSWTDGVYYRNSDTGGWTWMASPASQVAAADFDVDCVDDLIGVWSPYTWIKYSKTGTWAVLGSAPNWLSIGDMNGDGKPDLLGTWNDGVYYRDTATGTWYLLAGPAAKVAAGDLDGDGKDDLIGDWPSQGGTWVKYSSLGLWSRVASSPAWLAAGDMNSNGRVDLVGSWTGDGVYFMDTKAMLWTKLASPASKVATGDLDGDGKVDLLGQWTSTVWVRYAQSGSWQALSSGPTCLYAGKMRAKITMPAQVELWAPRGGIGLGPAMYKDHLDLSKYGPGSREFVFVKDKNLVPNEDYSEAGLTYKMKGPGDPGFAYVTYPNLKPKK